LTTAERLAALPAEARQEVLAAFDSGGHKAISQDWRIWARPDQLPPPEPWSIWMQKSGRGSGKTRSGAEWFNRQAKHTKYLGLFGPTADDIRDVMIEGESGILACGPNKDRPEYFPSKKRLVYPNGAIATIRSAEEPERMRGPQYGKGWADEVGAWQYGRQAFDMVMFGLRLGINPQLAITTTPPSIRTRKVNIHANKKLLKDIIALPGTVVTHASSHDNPYLPAVYFETLIRPYEGTVIGRAEIYAEIVEDVEGALWKQATIDEHRLDVLPQFSRIVIGVDPSGSADEEASEVGIVACGVTSELAPGATSRKEENHYFVLEDLSGHYTPEEWARRVVYAYAKWQADVVVAETNYGGNMVVANIRAVDSEINVQAKTAATSKHIRAEPIANLYTQGRVHHFGIHEQLEDQMCTWVPGEKSPDRLDAMVWAMRELSEGEDWGWYVA